MAQKTLIIAGCTRSGLTLMMQILNKGGYPCLGNYPAFEDYQVGQIDFNKAKGKAIKLVDTHNQFPPNGDYYVIRLRRDLEQQSKSIIKFMRMMGIRILDRAWMGLKQSLEDDYAIIDRWAKRQKGVVYVDFETLLSNPKSVLAELKESFDIDLDPSAIDCVIERDANCYDGMLEMKLIADMNKAKQP